MPVTPYGGDGNSDWLQSLLASFGANQPYGPGGGGPMPGGARLPASVGGGTYPYPAATPGAPSMGYPAMGQPTPQPPPAAPNAFMRALNYFSPIGSAQADPLHPSQPSAPSPSPLLRADAADSLPLAFGNVTSDDYQNWLMAQQGGGGPPSPSPAPSSPGPAPPGVGGPYVGGQGTTPQTYPHMPWPDTGSSKAATHANAPPGNPSATPRPPRRSAGATTASPSSSSNPRFGTVQYQVPGAGGPLSRNPIYTSLNLFGARS